MKKKTKIAIVGAGDLAAKEFFRRVVDSGFDRKEILTFGSNVGPLEVLLEDENAEVFLPLARDYLVDAADVFMFDCDPEARRRVAEWTRETGATLVDSGRIMSNADIPADPFSDSFPVDDRRGPVHLPMPASLYLASFLRLIPETARLSVDCTVFEPASTLGEAGVNELFHQSASVLNFKAVPTEILGAQSAFHLFPSGRWERESFEGQVKSLFGCDLEITSVGATAPSFEIYTISALVGIEDAPGVEKEVRIAAGKNGPFHLPGGDKPWPGYAEVADADKPTVAMRVLSGNKLWVWLQFNHVRCGMGALSFRAFSRLRP